MTTPRYWKTPEEEGYYLLFTDMGRDFDYDAVYVTDGSCVGNDGSSWKIVEKPHVWYYGPIPKPEE
jgi:hypothetical protein